MAWRRRPAIGLSVGATSLAAVTADNAVTRRPVLTLYRHRQAEVGVPAENPNLDEPGLVIGDFVDRVGDPAAIVATDRSMHRPQGLVADGLRAIAYAATGGRPLPEAVAVTHPAHWPPVAVAALRAALRRVPEWAHGPLLVSDAAAALTAVQTKPGLPTRGIVAVCDFGGSGSSIILADAANGYAPVGATRRHTEFSGDLVDQALVNYVLAELKAVGSFPASVASAIGSLAGLRAECRDAKNRLAVAATTQIRVDLPGFQGDVELTRADLDDVIRAPLDTFVAVLRVALDRGGVGADLAAVAAVGGAANVPGIASRLSQEFLVPVITTPRPHLTAALGALLLAERSLAVASPSTVPELAPDATSMVDVAAMPDAPATPIWSPVDGGGVTPVAGDAGDISALPPEFESGEFVGRRARPWAGWYRRPVPMILATAVIALAVGGGIASLWRRDSPAAPATPSDTATSAPTSSTDNPATLRSITPASPVPAPEPPLPAPEPEPAEPPVPVEPETTEPPPTTTTQPPAVTTTQPATTAPSTTPTSSRASDVPHIPHIPHIP